MKKVYNNQYNQDDLDVFECGTERCESNHYYGPGVKEFYKIHYIHKGKGTFENAGKTYELSKGQGFIIYPNKLIYYKADEVDPWEYSWVGFYGIKAEFILKQSGFDLELPVFNSPNEGFINNCLLQMLEAEEFKFGRDTYLKGYLYLILSQHIEKSEHLLAISRSKDSKEIYVSKALEFIERNYDKKISVEAIADYLGINSKYLWRLFDNQIGISPIKVLLNKRIEKACKLMENQTLAISDISRSVGYEDPLMFSKMFKKIKGISPSYYKKNGR